MRWLTPFGPAGVAVASFARDQRQAILACLCTRRGAPLPERFGPGPVRATLQLDGVACDDLLLVDRGHELELHLHGSPALARALARRFLAQPIAASPAERLLRSALVPSQLQLAAEQGTVDFDAALAAAIAAPGPEQLPALRLLWERSRRAMAQAVPSPLVLVGAQNAGKSTLFNRLLHRERALVGPLAGMTRDPVRDATCLGGYPHELIDTAGEGVAASSADAAAIAQGRALRAGARCLLVVDGQVGPTAVDRALLPAATLVVATHADRSAAPWPEDVPIHVRTGLSQPAAALRAELGARLAAVAGLPWPAPGRVGGPAALDAGQWHRLRQAMDVAADDCVHRSPPA